VKVLLDTHAFLWLVTGDPKLTSKARTAIADPGNRLFLSAASVWELAIKIGNRKLVLSDPLPRYVRKWTRIYHIELLPIRSVHAVQILDLPHIHSDPFDRMLIAQTMREKMILLTGDARIGQYPITRIWS
jgi:PIN domain nuclease of toxin-antitoxin system